MYDQIKSLVEKKVAADAKALELNSQFVESFSKRNSAFVAAAFENVLSAAQQAGKVASIGDVIEKQVRTQLRTAMENTPDKILADLTQQYAEFWQTVGNLGTRRDDKK